MAKTVARQEKTLLEYGSLYDPAIPEIELWEQKSTHFVKTDIVTDILDILEFNHCVLLTGVSGIGKTLTAQNIALQIFHEKGYIIVLSSKANDIKKQYKDNIYQVFVFDDICGKYTANKDYIINWIDNMEYVKFILKKGKTKILATCRTEIFINEKSFQGKFDLFNKSVYELTVKYSFQDKIKIAKKFLKIDDQKVSDIIKNGAFSPLMLFLHSQHEHFDMNTFLNSPYETFREEWEKLKSFDKEKFCVLLLCVIYNGTIDDTVFDVSNEFGEKERKKLIIIFECCQLNRSHSRPAIKNKMIACIGTYLIKVDRKFNIIHDKMFDFLCCYFGKDFIEPILKYADDKLICERVQLESIQKALGEFTISVSSNDEHVYLDRLKLDLENGKIHWCLNNVQMIYKEYRDQFLKVFANLKDDDQKRCIDIKDDTGINSFISSCLRGYEDLVDHLLSVGADVDARNGWFTPLTAACRDGHFGTVNILLQGGSTVNKTNSDGETPLYTACFGGHYELVQHLIKEGAHINTPNNYNHTPLYVSCLCGHEKITRILICNGANLFQCSDLFIGAIFGGNEQIVELLIKNKCDVNSIDIHGTTALCIASEEGNTKIVKLLNDYNADIFKVDSIGNTPLHVACLNRNNDIVKILIDNNADVNMLDIDKETPLHKACRNGSVLIIQTLLEYGADTNIANIDGYTPLKLAKHDDQVKDDEVLTSLEEIKLELAEGVNTKRDQSSKFQIPNPDTRKNLIEYGWTPLYEACMRGDINDVQSLIKEGDIVNKENNSGEPPLIAACQQGYGILLQILLDKGADINQALFTAVQKDYEKTVNILSCKRRYLGYKRDYWKSLIALACQQGSNKAINILVDRGPDLDQDFTNDQLYIACTKGFDKIATLFIKKGAELNYRSNKDSKTLLCSACKQGFDKIAELLIENGANVQEKYENEKTLLHIVCNIKLYHLLTAAGLHSNIPDKNGKFPLFESIDKGFDDISKALITNGSPIATSEDDKKTALVAVFEKGNKELSMLLVTNGYTNNITNFNETMLYHASRLGLFEMVKFLIYSGADIMTKYRYGYTPAIIADIAGNDDLSEFLKSFKHDKFINYRKTYYAFIYYENRNIVCIKETCRCVGLPTEHATESDAGYKYLFLACINGKIKPLKSQKIFERININIFFKSTRRNGTIMFEQTPLCVASKRGHKKVVKLLLENGALVDLTFEDNDLENINGFFMTVQYGYTPLFAACQRKYYEIVDMLLERGANLNKAFYNACREGFLETVQFLIQKGAEVNAFGRFGQTAFHAACIGGYYDIVKILIERGAHIDTNIKRPKTNEVITGLHTACFGGNHEIVQLLIDRGASVNEVSYCGRTLLHIACMEGFYNIVEKLIDKGVDMNASDMYGATPLLACILQNKANSFWEKYFHYQRKRGNSHSSKDNVIYRRQEDKVIEEMSEDSDDEWMNDAGYDELMSDDSDYECISYIPSQHKRNFECLTDNHLRVVQQLIEKGADINKADKKGREPIYLAKQTRDTKLIDILSYFRFKKTKYSKK